ncbi:MAG: hypothetical protein ACRCX2_30160 [Paraclostridium sp.]
MEQPIKFITVVMKDATSTIEYPSRKLTNKIGYAISIDGDGLGFIHKSRESSSTTEKGKLKPVVGVLMESFPHDMCQTKVITQGVVDMPIFQHSSIDSTTIKPGDAVYAHDGMVGDKAKIGDELTSYLGVALTGGTSTKNDTFQTWVSVLLK